MIEAVVNYVTQVIYAIGYPGIFILMMLESTMFPLPSELVMPFAGFLVASGKMSFAFALIASILGSITGSFISYYMGFKGGKYFIKRVGRYFFLDGEHLEKANSWFKRYGGRTIFFCRFVPGIRHVISIPAGVGKMNLSRFTLFTVLGAGIWNTILLMTGFILERNWKLIYEYTQIIDMVLIAAIFILVIYWVFSLVKRNRKDKVKI